MGHCWLANRRTEITGQSLLERGQLEYVRLDPAAESSILAPFVVRLCCEEEQQEVGISEDLVECVDLEKQCSLDNFEGGCAWLNARFLLLVNDVFIFFEIFDQVT